MRRVTSSRRVLLRTYGCQMNVHDSEKIVNLLRHEGWQATDALDRADLLIVNTCSIRDRAEHRLYSDLGVLRAWKQASPGRLLGVGGCVAQQQGDRLLRRFPQVDFVFGTHNLRHVPAMVEAARRGTREAQTRESSGNERFELPERHPDLEPATPGRAFVTVMEGCDLFCSFCIVPLTRGREISRPAAAILREGEALAASGVREITLLGQTVNAYGRHELRRGGGAGTLGFAALLAQLGAIPGLARIRYTSPHPSFFDTDLIRAHAELPELCPHVHLPLQSGSDAMLGRMRRRYGADDYRRLVERLREARPDVALTTDLIVGHPGETDADFEATLALVREVRFVDAYTFKYSARPGTLAARAPDPLPAGVLEERLEALQQLLRGLTLDAHRKRVGDVTEVLVEGRSRRGGLQATGRDPYHRVVNFPVTGDSDPAPGELLALRIVEATPHSLIGERLESVHGALGPLTGVPGQADERSWSSVSGP
jgi:tRNA-2-methylthio-N6-dimethylallyladenosine synthase